MLREAKKWEADPERAARGFNAGHYRKLLEKAWEEAAFVFREGTFCLRGGRKLESKFNTKI